MMTVVLTYLSFALAVSGLVAQVTLGATRRRKAFVAVVITSLVVLSGFAAYEAAMHARRVEVTSQQIVRVLGSGLKTFDELAESLNRPDLSHLSESLEALIEANRVGQRIVDVRDDYGRRLRVRGYYLVIGNHDGVPR
jgi:hypothetical protein